MRVKVPPYRCSSDSITPTVATSHQSVKRGEKAVTGSLIWNPVEHEPMDSVSEDVSELSLTATSQIRLIGWSQKAKDKEGQRVHARLTSTPNKPGREHHPNGSNNGSQERENPSFAL
jgi:hypothetical protein